jgi:methylated-DNA-protein-cysteine methyltransferase-like protein
MQYEEGYDLARRDPFTERVVYVIKHIPEGKVLTYGRVSAVAGNPRGARQVVRILHTMTGKHALPWHRVINTRGMISLRGEGGERQRELLESEGVVFDECGVVDLKRYLWSIDTMEDVFRR